MKKKEDWQIKFNKIMFEHKDGGVTLDMTKIKLKKFILQLLKEKEKEVKEEIKDYILQAQDENTQSIGTKWIMNFLGFNSQK